MFPSFPVTLLLLFLVLFGKITLSSFDLFEGLRPMWYLWKDVVNDVFRVFVSAIHVGDFISCL